MWREQLYVCGVLFVRIIVPLHNAGQALEIWLHYATFPIQI